MMKIKNYSRFLSGAALFCGGLAGLLFLLYPYAFPDHSTLEGVMLVAAFLGTACQRLIGALFIKPVLYYSSLMQLILLQPYIGERTRNEIIRELTIKYFLGEHHRN